MDENYFKLLKAEQELTKTGEYLSLPEEKRLLSYKSRISDHFRWEHKNHFIKVMVDLLEDKIDLDQYIDRLYKIESQIEKYEEEFKSDFKKLLAFEPDQRSKGFAILIENLFSDIRILEPNDELRTDDEISGESLRHEIKKFLTKIQEY